MNIDDIADQKTGERSPGEKFRDQWLSSLPKAQWPNYIDDTAPLIKNGGALGDTDLTTADFPRETGWLYRRGLAATARSTSNTAGRSARSSPNSRTR